MGKANEMKQRLKKAKRETQAMAGYPQLKWKKCGWFNGRANGLMAEITPEQSKRLK